MFSVEEPRPIMRPKLSKKRVTLILVTRDTTMTRKTTMTRMNEPIKNEEPPSTNSFLRVISAFKSVVNEVKRGSIESISSFNY